MEEEGKEEGDCERLLLLCELASTYLNSDVDMWSTASALIVI